jgi:hypothetical protein
LIEVPYQPVEKGDIGYKTSLRAKRSNPESGVFGFISWIASALRASQ